MSLSPCLVAGAFRSSAARVFSLSSFDLILCYCRPCRFLDLTIFFCSAIPIFLGGRSDEPGITSVSVFSGVNSKLMFDGHGSAKIYLLCSSQFLVLAPIKFHMKKLIKIPMHIAPRYHRGTIPSIHLFVGALNCRRRIGRTHRGIWI
jgi:hypothetical protein